MYPFFSSSKALSLFYLKETLQINIF